MAASAELNNGSNIAVIGGGPAGSFFSLFALSMAELIDLDLNITIFEPKDFTRSGPAGCNHCGGIVSELLVQSLAIEGINLPDSVVQKGLNSYVLNTRCGSVRIETPELEKTIAAVYRAGVPGCDNDDGGESFDRYLLTLAGERGARIVRERVNAVDVQPGRPSRIQTGRDHVLEADLVVGAFGVNSATWKLFSGPDFHYEAPRTIITAIGELLFDQADLTRLFGNAVHLFLLPEKKYKFAAMIPKGNHVTVCLLGKHLDRDAIPSFLEHPIVRKVLNGAEYSLSCRCLPRMNTGAPKRPYADGLVMCGDAGSSRLFKDGIGSAYIMGKAVAETAVFHGITRKHFDEHYLPVYRSIIRDNSFGRILFFETDLLKRNRWMTRAMLQVVKKEQNSKGRKILSSILWDMFTGSERYRDVFLRSMNIPLFARYGASFVAAPFTADRSR